MEKSNSKACGWARFVVGETADCLNNCPFEKDGERICVEDIFQDAMDIFWQVFNEAYRKHRNGDANSGGAKS